eukprot:3804832-Pyramimonas_sp.AAC.1
MEGGTLVVVWKTKSSSSASVTLMIAQATLTKLAANAMSQHTRRRFVRMLAGPAGSAAADITILVVATSRRCEKKNTLPLKAGGRGASTTMSNWGCESGDE